MSENISLHETEDALSITVGEVEVARYIFEPTAPTDEAPKPFLHPIRTLSGAPVSGYRPWDHRWHKGLQMTWSHVSGENFWGGPTFHVDEGYRMLNNLGSIRHESFGQVGASDTRIEVEEHLGWFSSTDERWFTERRTHVFHSADTARGLWALDFDTTLTNVTDRDFALGSPGTEGRENAGYTGYFWRGPRSFTGGDVVSSTGKTGDDIMGSVADWVAFTGRNDEIDGEVTLLAFAGSGHGDIPIRWFVRSEPFPCLAPSPAFDTEIVLNPGESVALRHRYVVIDQALPQADLATLAEEFAL